MNRKRNHTNRLTPKLAVISAISLLAAQLFLLFASPVRPAPVFGLGSPKQLVVMPLRHRITLPLLEHHAYDYAKHSFRF